MLFLVVCKHLGGNIHHFIITYKKKQIASFISFSCDGLPDLSEHHQWTTSSGREGIDVMGELIASHLVEDDE